MWGPRCEPPAIEKIRKVPWSAENTKTTQRVVDDLYTLRDTLKAFSTTGNDSQAVHVIRMAIRRFKALDVNVITRGAD